MPEYTVVNLKEVEDSAPKFGFAPELEARFPTGELELTKSAISYQRLAPGFRVPFGHKHKKQEELYVIIDGSARLKLDDEVIDVKKWDAVRVPAEVTRCFEGGPDGVELLAIGAPNTGPSPRDDGEPIPNWWSD